MCESVSIATGELQNPEAGWTVRLSNEPVSSMEARWEEKYEGVSEVLAVGGRIILKFSDVDILILPSHLMVSVIDPALEDK